MAETWAISGVGTSVHGPRDWETLLTVTAGMMDMEVRDRMDFLYGLTAGSALKDFDFNGVQSPGVGASGFAVKVRGTLTEAASGTHPLMAGLHVVAPTITAGAATVTATASVYVSAAPAGGVSNYALFVDAGVSRFDDRVLIGSGTVTGPGLTFLSDPTSNTGLYFVSDDIFGLVTGGVERLRIGSAGAIYVNETADTDLTTGISINQAGADNAILTFKSSDVSHGVTDFVETDTYAKFWKYAGDDGGVRVDGFTEAKTGVLIGATVTTVEDGAAKSAASAGAIHIAARKKSGTNVTALGAGNNILVVYDNTNAKFVISGEGDLHHASATILTFDEHDDLALLNALQAILPGGDRIDAEYRTFLAEHVDALYDAGIISSARGDPDVWVNDTRLTMLMVGALRQAGLREARLTERIERLEQRALPAGGVA